MSNTITEEFYTYGVTFAALGNGQTAQNNILIEADSAFRVNKLSAAIAAGSQASTRGVPVGTIIIRDTGSGRQLMNQAIMISSLFGTGDNPFILPVPRLFAPRSTINFEVTNLSGADFTLQLSLHGAKVYRR